MPDYIPFRSDAAFIRAITDGDLIAVSNELVARQNIASLDREHPGGLVQLALKSKHISRMHILSLLIKRGARYDIGNDFGIPPLFEVLTATQDNVAARTRALNTILRAGADPNTCVPNERIEIGAGLSVHSGESIAALCIAAQVGDLVALEMLLDAGANPHGPGSSVSPLRMASSWRQPACVASLLMRGAKFGYVDDEGLPAIASVKDLESLALLLSAGARLDTRVGPERLNLLHVWCENNADDQMLRRLGAQHPEQIWERDIREENAPTKLWLRWSQTKELWIPQLIADWELTLLEQTPVAPGRQQLPSRL